MNCKAKGQIVVGAIWRRKKTGALVRITGTRGIDYLDISWETVEKPVRRGQSYETYWLRNCEPFRSLMEAPMSDHETAENDAPPHRCDTGHFDRTICPEPCGYMHSYCATCGKRQDPCAHDAAPIPPAVTEETRHAE